MAMTPLEELRSLCADKQVLRRHMDEIETHLGGKRVPENSVELVRSLMLADGIRAEDNAFSRDILGMRYGNEDED